jgi:pimeloyl-ACP methyl ester carboxylesterase
MPKPLATSAAGRAGLHFDSEGDGPLIVLLHGFPQYRIAWQKQLPVLAAAGYRAVAPDLRGYGESPKPTSIDDYRMPLVVEDVAELIRTLNVEQTLLSARQEGVEEGADRSVCSTIVVGHDWGALVAWFLAMIHPDLVSKLVILNVPHPALFARELKRSGKQRAKAAYQLFFQLPVLPELFMRVFGRTLMKKAGRFTPEQIDAFAANWKTSMTPMLHYYRAMRRTRGELRKIMRRIDVPTMIIWGEWEPVFVPQTLVGTEEWVPHLRIARVPKAGHFIQNDAPERVNELLLEFLSSRAG